jgi:GH15 family glucan-1,4-alpha-glucosidase
VTRCFNSDLNTFTQYYGGTALDASLLILSLSGFLPATDARVVGTVEALERDLLQNGLLLRFKPEAEVDGLSGEEGVFLACSFWLATVYQMMGRAEAAMHRIQGRCQWLLFTRLLSATVLFVSTPLGDSSI